MEPNERHLLRGVTRAQRFIVGPVLKEPRINNPCQPERQGGSRTDLVRSNNAHEDYAGMQLPQNVESGKVERREEFGLAHEVVDSGDWEDLTDADGNGPGDQSPTGDFRSEDSVKHDVERRIHKRPLGVDAQRSRKLACPQNGSTPMTMCSMQTGTSTPIGLVSGRSTFQRIDTRNRTENWACISSDHQSTIAGYLIKHGRPET